MRRIKILAKKSLQMSPGKLAAQAVHAALGLANTHPLMSVVVLQVSATNFNQSKLARPECYVVKDAGYTEVTAGTETCLAYYEEDERDVVGEMTKVVDSMIDEARLRLSYLPEEDRRLRLDRLQAYLDALFS